MRMIGLSHLIHLNAGGDGVSLLEPQGSKAMRAKALRRRHEPDSFSFYRS
jgi:hypothetical protein